MRSIAILNQKGGSGKTTTAVNLAASLGAQDRPVLVLDLGPRASATDWFGVANSGRGNTDIIVDRVIASMETLRPHLNHELRVSTILTCRVNPRTRHARHIVDELRSRFGNLVSHVEIRKNVRLAEAPAHHLPITLCDRRSKGAEDYLALADEIIAAVRSLA